MEVRVQSVQAALQRWHENPGPGEQKIVEQAFADLFHDWNPAEMSEVQTALKQWQQTPTPAQAKALAETLEAWSKQRPPVALTWLDVGGTSQIIKYVEARFRAVAPDQGIGIDLMFGGGTDNYVRFAGEGLLAKTPMPEAIRKRIRPELNGVALYDPQDRWYGAMLSSFGIMANRWVLKRIGEPEPQLWQDLGRPGLQGWVGAGDPRWSGSVHMVYEIILQARGWDDGFRLLLRLGANTHSFLGDSGTLTRMVEQGEMSVAGNVDAMAFIAVAREPNIVSYHLPADGTIINPDSIGVLRGAPHPELARAFVEFTLSDAGQKLFFLQPGIPGGPRRYPLARLSIVEDLYKEFPPDQRSVGDVNPFTYPATLRYNSKLGYQRWSALNDLIGAVIVDAHPNLVAAWRAVLSSGLPDEKRRALETELFAPFCTEAELLEHARRINEEGPRSRAEAVNRWGRQALERYDRVTRQAGES
jgi:ABC-type Fe3+ transport system substrate-binding protein